MNRMLIATITLLILACSAVGGCTRDNRVLVVEQRTPVYKMPYPNFYNAKGNVIIVTLEEGDEVRVLNHKYGKDFLAYEVKLEDGRRGYVVHGPGFSITDARDPS